MNVSGSIIGGKGLVKSLKKLDKKANKAAFDRVKMYTLDVHRNALNSISEESRGSVETRYNPKRKVVVSKPGDAPNTDRGTLIKSIKFLLSKTPILGQVGTNYKVGAHLEFGTTEMRKRPWLLPAFKKSLIHRKRGWKLVPPGGKV